MRENTDQKNSKYRHFSRGVLYGFLEKTNLISLYIAIGVYIWLWLFVVLERHQWALLLFQNLFFNKRYKCSHFIYFLSTFSLERRVLQIWLSPLLDFLTTNLIACLNLTSLLFMYYEFGYVKTFFKSSFEERRIFDKNSVILYEPSAVRKYLSSDLQEISRKRDSRYEMGQKFKNGSSKICGRHPLIFLRTVCHKFHLVHS